MSCVARSRTTLLLVVALMLAFAPSPLQGQADDGLGPSDQASSVPDSELADEPGADAEPGTLAEGEQAPGVTAAEEQTPAQDAPGQVEPASSQRAIGFYAGAGLGLGTLAFERPTAQGVQRLPQTPFAAAELLLRMRAWPHDRFSLELLLAYQTSLGLVLQAAPLFALPQNVDARWQRVELSAAPIVRLGEAANAPSLAFPLGFVMCSLFPGVHQFSVPKYRLAGPQLRAELLVQLGDFVSLRVGPEAEWLVVIDSSLRREGACCQGVAFGGRGSIEASVGPTIRLALAYGESHAFVPVGSWRFMDAERFLTARIAGAL